MLKKKSILFTVACMALCLIPSVGMLFFPTTQTTENRAMSDPPRLLTEDGTLNRAFFSDFERYFTEHLALRNQLVYADAMIQSKVFHESNISGVITGTDGWLFYSSTLSDYLGTDILSERELYNLAHNIRVVQEFLRQRDIRFLFTIPPNKNTLYGEYMPYYKSFPVQPEHSAILLEPYLAEQEVCYLDLFTLFDQQDEVLYLLRDSHWNNKGACLAYNAIMDALALDHEDYSALPPALVKNENGDLNKMLYSFYGEPEENYSYTLAGEYAITNNASSVEDGWIISENSHGTGTLLMFRDSFANTLIPFLSAEFETACYSKGEPHALQRYVESYDPDCVVIEKVERNISNYLDNPPILSMPEAVLPRKITIAETDTTAQLEDCLYDAAFYKLSGTVDPTRLHGDSEILVSVDGTVYRAYHTGEFGYALYLKKSDFSGSEVTVRVYAVHEDAAVQALHAAIKLPG